MRDRRLHHAEYPDEPGAPLWMLTFSDLMSLIVTFFALLVSFAEPRQLDYARMTVSVGSSFALYRLDSVRPVLKDSIASWMAASAAAGSGQPLRTVRVERPGIAVPVEIPARLTERKSSPAVRIPVFFEEGGTGLRADAYPLLDKIVRLFRASPFDVQVQGFADDLDSSAGSAVRQDLAAGRALAVAQYLTGSGIAPDRVSAAACSEYRTERSRLVRDNRLARHAEIVLLEE